MLRPAASAALTPNALPTGLLKDNLFWTSNDAEPRDGLHGVMVLQESLPEKLCYFEVGGTALCASAGLCRRAPQEAKHQGRDGPHENAFEGRRRKGERVERQKQAKVSR